MDSEIYDNAQAIMHTRRSNAVFENEKRINEINEKIPQIREVNNQIYNTGKELIKIMTAHRGADSAKMIEQLKNYNLGAQSMSRQLLSANGYPPDYLDIHYNCPKCQDTGYYNNEFCDCFKKLCGSLAAAKMNRNAQLKLSSFDTFSLSYYKGDDYFTMNHILQFTKNYAENFNLDSDSIFMYGKTGLGKTHLSLAVANRVLEKGYSVIYDSIINILQKIEREHFSRDHNYEMLDLVMETDLLILDDLGTEYESQFYSSTIYNIINPRLNSGKPTIINTNLELSVIRRRYDERVVSRITGIYRCMEFKGEDVRFQLKQKELKNKNTL